MYKMHNTQLLIIFKVYKKSNKFYDEFANQSTNKSWIKVDYTNSNRCRIFGEKKEIYQTLFKVYKTKNQCILIL